MSDVTRNENKEMSFFSVFIDLRASSKLALSVRDYKVTLDVHRHLIFLPFFRHEICLTKGVRELLIINESARKKKSHLVLLN